MTTLAHITDLHLDHWPNNLDAAMELLNGANLDLILIGGDNGNDDGLLRTIDGCKRGWPNAEVAWVMGNHDLWHRPYSDLWNSFEQVPATYLELQNLETNYCTVVGTYGHYDYRGGLATVPFEQYETFTDGKHTWNDRYIDRLGQTNPQIAAEIAERFRERYSSAITRRLPIIVLSHTWPFAPTDETFRSFFGAYGSNQLIGDIIISHSIRPSVLFCGHTHHAARWDEFGFPMINTGSDYQEVRVTKWDLENESSRENPTVCHEKRVSQKMGLGNRISSWLRFQA